MTYFEYPPAVTLPPHVEERLAVLRAATDERERVELESHLTPAAIGKPVEAAQQVSDTELATVDARLGDSNRPAAKVMKAANGQVGYHRRGSDRTKYGGWYGLPSREWCDMFVSWVFHQAGQLKAIGGKHSYVPAHLDWFRQHRRLYAGGVMGGEPRRGCVVFLDLYGHDGADHVGIVVSYDDTHIYTIEGNRSGHVRKVKYARSSRQITGYGYPNWT